MTSKSTKKKDYYKILNVDKTATEKEIKKQYRTLAMKNHPDKGGDSDKFKDIAEAYEVLSNPEKRKQYDNPGFNFHQHVVNPDEIFKNFFGNNKSTFEFNDQIFGQSMFNNFSFENNMSRGTNNYSKSTSMYMNGNVKIEKTTEINNGIKTETTKETNLMTGEVKNSTKRLI